MIILFYFLGLGVFLLIASPFFIPRASFPAFSEAHAVQADPESFLAEMQDLKAEYEAGKISEEDYQQIRRDLARELKNSQ